MADAELKVSVDTDQFKAILDDFVQNTLPNAVREIVRDEMVSQESKSLMYEVSKIAIRQAIGYAASSSE